MSHPQPLYACRMISNEWGGGFLGSDVISVKLIADLLWAHIVQSLIFSYRKRNVSVKALIMTACLQANFNWLISLNVYHCEFFSSKKKKQNKDKNAE